MSRKWTPPQLEAIRTTGTSLLVSAAAGSGKTSVLAERCAYLVCDAPSRCNVSQLLVVTFTEAAAAEMRSRIEQALRQRLRDSGDDPHLRKQLALIDHANISTLHSFCNRLLRQHFHRAGLDPAFRVLDADESTLMRLEVVRSLFMDYYDRAESHIFRDFIDAFGEGDDESLVHLVLRTYELLRSLVDPKGWMDASIARVEEAAKQPLSGSALGREYLAIVQQRLADLLRDTRAAVDSVARLQAFPQYVTALQELLALAESWSALLANRGYDALVEAVKAADALPRLNPVREGTPGKEVAKAQVDAVREQFRKGPLVQALRFTTQEWQQGLASTLPHLRIFLQLLEDFARRYRAEKQLARAVDFSDLERYAFNLLNDARRGDPIRPSAVARQLHRQFQHVLVDEYQDINELQDGILALASRECLPPAAAATPNLFCVGDVKQSIYGFRLAEPALFLDRRARFQNDPAAGRVIDLQANFRSRAPLLNVLNQVFERLMTAQAVDIEYDTSQRLHPAAEFPPAAPDTFAGAPIELHVLPEDMERTEDAGDDADLERSQREALLIAQRIQELMGHSGAAPRQVAVRNPDGTMATRPLQYRDIVILLRATRFHADQYASILRQFNIPVYNAGGGGYFDAMEVRDVLSLLRLMDNQQQDIPLAAVLRSPLSGLPQPEESLARVRLAYPDPALPFHGAVTRYAAEQDDELAAKLRDFLADLKEWRTLARQRPIADILWLIFEHTGFLAFCSGLENGPQRVANLLRLYERARQFGAFSRQGLYRFNRFLESLDEETDPAQASELSEGENVVRILSIHKSKGLEFPVVFVPALGKRINFQETGGRIVVDRHAHLGLDAIDMGRRIRYPSLASTLVSQRLRRNALAEEVRVLYVALTRAREHLILVGTCPAGKVDEWSRRFDLHHGPLPASTILSAGTMLDWLGPVSACLSSHDGGASIALQEHPSEAVQEWMAAMPRTARRPELSSALSHLDPLHPPPLPHPDAQAVIARMTHAYAHPAFTTLPAAVSVADLARSAGPLSVTLRQPRFLLTGASPVERGAVTHQFLQHLDFARPASEADLREQAARLTQQRILPPQAPIDFPAILWFLATPLGQLLRRSAGQLLRELPLTCAIPPTALIGAASPDPQDQVMLRGRLDLLAPDPAGYVLVDYKTDDITPDQVPARSELYRPQLALYRDALARLLPRPVHAMHLVFLAPRQIVTL